MWQDYIYYSFSIQLQNSTIVTTYVSLIMLWRTIMNTKRIFTLLAIVAILFLSGCVAPPYYGGTGYYSGVGVSTSYRFQPSFYGNQRMFGGHRHFRSSHRVSGHRRHSNTHRGGHHRGHNVGHRGGHRSRGGGHRGSGYSDHH